MEKHRNIHVLFSLSLFLLFVIGSFFIVTYEIKGYQAINDTSKQVDDLIVPLAYFNTKLKANDQEQTCQVVDVDNVQCLQITTAKTNTLIYFQDGYIKELYVSNDYHPELDEGSNLFAVDDLVMEQTARLYKFTVFKDGDNKSITVYLHGGAYEI